MICCVSHHNNWKTIEFQFKQNTLLEFASTWFLFTARFESRSIDVCTGCLNCNKTDNAEATKLHVCLIKIKNGHALIRHRFKPSANEYNITSRWVFVRQRLDLTMQCFSNHDSYYLDVGQTAQSLCLARWYNANKTLAAWWTWWLRSRPSCVPPQVQCPTTEQMMLMWSKMLLYAALRISQKQINKRIYANYRSRSILNAGCQHRRTIIRAQGPKTSDRRSPPPQQQTHTLW